MYLDWLPSTIFNCCAPTYAAHLVHNACIIIMLFRLFYLFYFYPFCIITDASDIMVNKKQLAYYEQNS